MPLKIRYIGLVVPLLNIRKSKLNFTEYLLEQSPYLGTQIDYDGFIYVHRAMSPEDIESTARFWKDQGLTDIVLVDGDQNWQDLCVIDYIGGATLPCTWIEYSRDDACAWMKGCKFETTVPENRELLLKEAWDVNRQLDQLIDIRNRRMKETGTFVSLLKRQDFKMYYDMASSLVMNLSKKVFLYGKIKNASIYKTFTDVERQLFDCLLEYTQAMHLTATKLSELTEATYQKSLSASKGINYADYVRLDKEYEESIEGYMKYGTTLNSLFKQFNVT